MSTANHEETRIRELTEAFVAAVGAKDLDRIMAGYADEVIAFDAVGELQFKGAQLYREHWQRCLSFCQGEGLFEIHDMDVQATGDLAFGHFLSHCGGQNEQGEMQTCWMRGTRCWRKQGGEWKVVHEHFSAPFDMQSGAVRFDLQPESGATSGEHA
ncbi:DUF4440 domain-containing protein [Stutzerimonas nosocomialis]|uniref:DUF4440 domain-containing protein n=1 Tax=Stutzerimonas nosocomialis TaxID=1056496 RepID=A0A5R9QBD9_9GAMM|nr:nuclear transport factor 2 family protein [Stutzerimonas nosocomialis]TLX62446.1 DUF4440 domain-containing protein [Stutzerimonas nosocomialis]